MSGKITYQSFSFGYNFEENKEVISLIFINYFLIVLFSVIVFMLHVADEELLPVTYRYHSIIVISLLNLLLIRYKHPKIARASLLILFPFLLMLLPHLAGLRDNEFYFWFPYVPIGFSLIAQFTLHPRKEQYLLLTFLLTYLLLGLLIDNIMIYLSDMKEEIIPLVQNNRFYYNLIPVFLYVFVNIGIGLILRQNDLYEERLHEDGQLLEASNLKLSAQKRTLLEKNRDLDQTLKQLYVARDKLLQSEKLAALGRLSAGIAHEINNPLNFISVSLHEMSSLVGQHPDLFTNETNAELKERYLELMSYAEEGVERATAIVTKLGTLKTRKSEATDDVKIEVLIQNALREIENVIPLDVSIITDIPGSLTVSCIAHEIQQVILNILSNAFDALRNKVEGMDKQIIISGYDETVEDKKFTTISISNNGPGIAAEDLHKIFDPFFTTKRQGEGSGLGLSVCFNTVQQHKGIIAAENRDDMVVFLVSLPQLSV